MTRTIATEDLEHTSTQVDAKGAVWTEPSIVSGTPAPDVAASARTSDLVSDIHATICTAASTESSRGLGIGRIFHSQCAPESWVDVTTEFTYQGPAALGAGGVLTVSVAGDGRNEYWAELVSTEGSAAGKLAAPDERISKRRWSMSWTVTDQLEPGDDVTVVWRMSGAEAVDPSRGSHIDATFLYPSGEYTGISEGDVPWIGAPANSTGVSGGRYLDPTRFYGFVSAP